MERDRYVLKVLNRAFGSLILHEITAHRIEQFKRERLAGKWQGHGHTSAPKPIKPGTVNREMDTLRSVFSQALEWGQIREHPMREVKRLKSTTAARGFSRRPSNWRCWRPAQKTCLGSFGWRSSAAPDWRVLALTWDDVLTTELMFLETKNGRSRRLPRSPAIDAVLKACPRGSRWVFTNPQTHKPYTVNGVAHVFKRAVLRAGITTAT